MSLSDVVFGEFPSLKERHRRPSVDESVKGIVSQLKEGSSHIFCKSFGAYGGDTEAVLALGYEAAGFEDRASQQLLKAVAIKIMWDFMCSPRVPGEGSRGCFDDLVYGPENIEKARARILSYCKDVKE